MRRHDVELPGPNGWISVVNNNVGPLGGEKLSVLTTANFGWPGFITRGRDIEGCAKIKSWVTLP